MTDCRADMRLIAQPCTPLRTASCTRQHSIARPYAQTHAPASTASPVPASVSQPSILNHRSTCCHSEQSEESPPHRPQKHFSTLNSQFPTSESLHAAFAERAPSRHGRRTPKAAFRRAN